MVSSDGESSDPMHGLRFRPPQGRSGADIRKANRVGGISQTQQQRYQGIRENVSVNHGIYKRVLGEARQLQRLGHGHGKWCGSTFWPRRYLSCGHGISPHGRVHMTTSVGGSFEDRRPDTGDIGCLVRAAIQLRGVAFFVPQKMEWSPRVPPRSPNYRRLNRGDHWRTWDVALYSIHPFREYKSQGCFNPGFSLQPRVNQGSRPWIRASCPAGRCCDSVGWFWNWIWSPSLLRPREGGKWRFHYYDCCLLSQPVNRAASGANAARIQPERAWFVWAGNRRTRSSLSLDLGRSFFPLHVPCSCSSVDGAQSTDNRDMISTFTMTHETPCACVTSHNFRL